MSLHLGFVPFWLLFGGLWVAIFKEVWSGALLAIVGPFVAQINRAIKDSIKACLYLRNLGHNTLLVSRWLLVGYNGCKPSSLRENSILDESYGRVIN